ncbi:MAG TPA: biotin--[acetyl-CoA-carboxylase] ligase [Holophaga sp.]|nr:biotin--[acetyl-CoA-carboxylase] ligase [Holophaga sp.]
MTVNVNPHLDGRDLEILGALRAGDPAVSGQVLATRLGITRVALWKRIERLKGLSYRIEGSPKGYRLLEEDVVVPWAFLDGGAVVYRSETTSTMDEAWRLAEDGAPSGTMVVADHQSAGRGRQDSAWPSPGGGLYLTLVLRSRLPASHAACLALEGACALAGWLESAHGLRLGLGWPGDLMAGDVKVGGLLVEQAGPLDAPRFCLLGLGVHLRGGGGPQASLADLMAHPPLRRDLAQAFRDHLAAWAEAPRCRPRDWETRLTQFRRSVTVQDWRGRTFQGVVRGLDDRGALRLAGPRARRETLFLPGEVARLLPADSGDTT